ncbi:probable plastid-lipid-associated protein 2, chloroplastic [Coccomyxa sp. Obi]|nr:probable plastid-lipid-associated protein 2, chloroplastic [Coccomyxa sp. Obi]
MKLLSYSFRQQPRVEAHPFALPPRKHVTYAAATRSNTEIAEAKSSLLDAIAPTNRGGTASSTQRCAVLDAQVGLESLSGGPVDYNLLPGRWRLIYTTAPDVRPLLISERASPFQVGNIYQEFSTVERGEVQNIIEFRVPRLLREGTAVVRAKYDVRSPKRIRLAFVDAGVRDLNVADELEALIAPAILPRSWLNHQVLLALREAEVFVPLRTSLPGPFPGPFQSASNSLERSFGSEYLLTYLDDDTLIGSQTGTGGTFIFARS